ncbi:MAG: hypothetical protein A2087_11595 [Spirochaetes bacterium GWD1_61_31]|nr:MAG: hypothetical protein A2Y37_14825 [Spirochaetes bacterium GWB1_60_80]OHD29336.1 MAG: hypothetical protein A2004_08325 [Spirochaetes bacterium GWC1_61_12]OHD35843.1 MAG: hypothetical protein A2087_11595 [Spirochaetes bacterium GWD1_61_31]OHD46785.1 MAG: hypothetical protein A2Y35_10765 [Spirochaetes bacterium GWE1_60_18]OHD61237.1 MAG: hypothetical protein A2Y32_13060 [Spirochaetes bacterium GWF1_60_12]
MKKTLFRMLPLAALAAMSLYLLPAQSSANPSTAPVAATSASLTPILDTMAANYYLSNLRAALGSFTWEYSNLPTPFARWLEEQLQAAVTMNSRLQLVNRNAGAAMDPAFRAEYEAFFRETETGALLHGRYFLEADNVRVRLELTDLGSGTQIAARDWLWPQAQVPGYASVAPAPAARERAQELARLGINSGGLTVSLSTSRGSGAAYRVGEQLEVLLTVSRDAYVRLYHIDSAGQIQLIWPNRFHGGNGLVRAGQTIRLPDASRQFSFNLVPPYGTEFLKAVASSLPFVDAVGDFADLGSDSRQVISRGLQVAGTAASATASAAPEMAESLASYYIGP